MQVPSLQMTLRYVKLTKPNQHCAGRCGSQAQSLSLSSFCSIVWTSCGMRQNIMQGTGSNQRSLPDVNQEAERAT